MPNRPMLTRYRTVALCQGSYRYATWLFVANYTGASPGLRQPAAATPRQARDPMTAPIEARLLEMVFPDHTNHLGTLFGGQALAWMDKAAFIVASRYARRTVVTRTLGGSELPRTGAHWPVGGTGGQRSQGRPQLDDRRSGDDRRGSAQRRPPCVHYRPLRDDRTRFQRRAHADSGACRMSPI